MDHANNFIGPRRKILPCDFVGGFDVRASEDPKAVACTNTPFKRPGTLENLYTYSG